MIIVGVINMVTALLVLILERTQMIGILKAMGSRSWSVQKIFIYTASYLAVTGLILGNAIGLSPIQLDPSIYYVTKAPISIDLPTILILNISTFLICLATLVIPSYLIARISPVKAIQFDS